MSSIKTTQIDGDVSVGRNVAMGGKAEIAGSVIIGHNLRVNGWLDAANIKGSNKGVFLTVADLREAYPTPHDGWFAGVGASTPFAAYIGHGGEWVATGGTISITADISEYTEEIEELQGDINEVKSDVEALETTVSGHTETISGISDTADAASAAATAAQQGVNTLNNKLGANSGIATLDSEGKLNSSQLPDNVPTLNEGKLDDDMLPDDVATLDENGKLPASQLPDLSDLDDVLEFYTVIESATINQQSLAKYSYDEGVQIVFVATSGIFAAKYNNAYYGNWLDMELFCDTNGIPHAGKTYICTSTDVLYYWKASAETLQPVGKDFGGGDGAFDISAAHSGTTYDNLAAALGTNGANVPASGRKGGMSVKFIQNIYATYSVVKTEGLDTEPTGTELQSASTVIDGVYTASQLIDFSNAASLPVTVNNSTVYYIAVTVDETTTYTKWIITKDTDDSSEYVQFRYMGTDVTTIATFTNTSNWQGVDSEPTFKSRNVIESRGVYNSFEGVKKTQADYTSAVGGIIYASGALSTNTAYTQCKYYTIRNNNFWKIRCVSTEKVDTIAAIAFYNTDTIDTSGYMKNESVPLTVTFTSTTCEALIPEDAKLIVVTYSAAYSHSFELWESAGTRYADGISVNNINNHFNSTNLQKVLEELNDKAAPYQKISLPISQSLDAIPVRKGDILIRYTKAYREAYIGGKSFRQVDADNNFINNLPYTINNSLRSDYYVWICKIVDDSVKYVNFPTLGDNSSRLRCAYILRRKTEDIIGEYTEFDSMDSLNVSEPEYLVINPDGSTRYADTNYMVYRIANDNYSSIHVKMKPGDGIRGFVVAFYNGEPSAETIMLLDSKMAYESLCQFDVLYEFSAKIPSGCKYILIADRGFADYVELYKNRYVYPLINDVVETYKNEYSERAKTIRLQHNSPSYQTNSADTFGSVTLKLLFWTDLHSYWTNLNHIVNLANYINSNEGGLDLMISGGDNLELGDEDPTLLNKYLSLCTVDCLVAEGNHERAAYHHGDAERAYNICIAPTLARVENVVAPEDSAANYRPYYYKDYNDVRIVILYTTYDQTEQLSWLTDVLTDAKTNSKHVILVNHPPHDNNYATMIYSTPQAYADAHVNTFHSAQGTLWGGTPFGGDTGIPAAYLLAVKSFEDAGGNFICWLTGHTHQDCFYDVTDHDTYGYQPMFNSASCAHKHSWHDLLKEAQTKTWDCINYITVDTTKKMLNIMRVGADVDTLGRGRHLLTYSYGTHTIMSNY